MEKLIGTRNEEIRVSCGGTIRLAIPREQMSFVKSMEGTLGENVIASRWQETAVLFWDAGNKKFSVEVTKCANDNVPPVRDVRVGIARLYLMHTSV